MGLKSPCYSAGELDEHTERLGALLLMSLSQRAGLESRFFFEGATAFADTPTRP